MDHWRLGHRPALDGLRGVAILLVLAAHFDNPWTNPFSGAGQVGVTLFFTLSGFLITSLLLDEHERTGKTSLTSFYARRARRLLPALFAVLAVVALLEAVGRSLEVSRGMLVSVALYCSNYWQLATNAPPNGLSQTWSLSIEEHFYLLWPALFLLGMRWGRRGVAIVAGLLGALSVLTMLLSSGMTQSWGTPQRAWSLLAGCLLAAWMSGRPEPLGSRRVLAAGFVVFAALAIGGDVVPVWLYLLAVPAVSAAVLWAASGAQLIRLLDHPVLRWFGKRSYGIYLWHYPVIRVVKPWEHTYWWAWTLIEFAVALVVAELSWRLVEQPALRWASDRESGNARNSAQKLEDDSALSRSAV